MIQAFGSSVYAAGLMDGLAVVIIACLLFAGAPRPPRWRDQIVAALLFAAALLNMPALVWLLRAQGQIRAMKSMHLPASALPPQPPHWIIAAMITGLTAVFAVLVMRDHQRMIPSFLFAALAGMVGAVGVLRNLGPRQEATSTAIVLCAVAMLVSLVCFAIKRLRSSAAEPSPEPAGPSFPTTAAAADLDAAFGPVERAVLQAYAEYDREPDGHDCG